MNKQWQDLLQKNGLNSFDDIWFLNAGWFEKPNKRGRGWSGVCRIMLKNKSGNELPVFLKRQQNYTSRTIRKPLTGILTLEREIKNIIRFKNLGIPTVEPIYFATHKQLGNHRAILITRELTGYISLDELMLQFRRDGFPNPKIRKVIIQSICNTLRALHHNHICHNGLYPSHIFLKIINGKKLKEPDNLDVRFIDLEKTHIYALKTKMIFRDLDTLNRRCPGISQREKLRFLISYLGNDYDNPQIIQLIDKFNVRRLKKQYFKTKKERHTTRLEILGRIR